jgi:cytochrome b561
LRQPSAARAALNRIGNDVKGSSGMGLNPQTPLKGGPVRGKPARSSGQAALIPLPRRLRVMHWLTVICVVMAAAFILTRDQLDGRNVRLWLLEGHRHFGLFVLALFVTRVFVRLRVGKLPSSGDAPWPMRAAAGLTHIVLYALLVTLPLLGWALSSAEGKPVHLFGATLPNFVAADEDLADTLQTWHLNAAWVLLGLVCLHIAAALWHHFIMRDGVLRRMWPKRRR